MQIPLRLVSLLATAPTGEGHAPGALDEWVAARSPAERDALWAAASEHAAQQVGRGLRSLHTAALHVGQVKAATLWLTGAASTGAIEVRPAPMAGGAA